MNKTSTSSPSPNLGEVGREKALVLAVLVRSGSGDIRCPGWPLHAKRFRSSSGNDDDLGCEPRIVLMIRQTNYYHSRCRLVQKVFYAAGNEIRLKSKRAPMKAP